MEPAAWMNSNRSQARKPSNSKNQEAKQLVSIVNCQKGREKKSPEREPWKEEDNREYDGSIDRASILSILWSKLQRMLARNSKISKRKQKKCGNNSAAFVGRKPNPNSLNLLCALPFLRSQRRFGNWKLPFPSNLSGFRLFCRAIPPFFFLFVFLLLFWYFIPFACQEETVSYRFIFLFIFNCFILIQDKMLPTIFYFFIFFLNDSLHHLIELDIVKNICHYFLFFLLTIN